MPINGAHLFCFYLARKERCAGGEGDQEEGHGGCASEDDCQAAGEDVIVAHRLCFHRFGDLAVVFR